MEDLRVKLSFLSTLMNRDMLILVGLCFFFLRLRLHPIHSKHTKSSQFRPAFFSVSPFSRWTRRPCAAWPNWPWRSARGHGPWSRFWRRQGKKTPAASFVVCRCCRPFSPCFVSVASCFFVKCHGGSQRDRCQLCTEEFLF